MTSACCQAKPHPAADAETRTTASRGTGLLATEPIARGLRRHAGVTCAVLLRSSLGLVLMQP